MSDKYGNEALTLAAYNMGETKLNSKKKNHGSDMEVLYEHLLAETQRYIPKVLARERILDNLGNYPNVQITQQPLFSQELDNTFQYVTKPGDYLIRIAQSHGLQREDVQRVNPEIINFSLIEVGQSLRIPKKIPKKA